MMKSQTLKKKKDRQAWNFCGVRHSTKCDKRQAQSAWESKRDTASHQASERERKVNEEWKKMWKNFGKQEKRRRSSKVFSVLCIGLWIDCMNTQLCRIVSHTHECSISCTLLA
jgi:hypothetical protein